MFILAQCYQETYRNPVTGGDKLGREDLLLLIIMTDCVSVLLLMAMIIFIDKTSERAA
jgi:hypothetical protein